LGWLAEQIVVVDVDLGVSGRFGSERDGYRQIVARLCMGEVGAVFGLEVSRFGRSNADLTRLMELARLTDTLLIDTDGVYDLANVNDRILLGLKVQTGRPFTARGVARIRDAYKIFGPRTVAVRDGEGQRQTGCRRARYPRRRRLQLAATRGGPRPAGVSASAGVSPWDPATREIYRQKVANSFRLKPVLADAAETNPTTGRRRLITRRCTGQRCARYGRTCPGPAWAADGTAERNISARRRVRIEAVRRRSAEPVEDQFV
jgi:hypothetical protein